METLMLLSLVSASFVGFASCAKEDWEKNSEGSIYSSSSSNDAQLSSFGPGIHYRVPSDVPIFYTAYIPIIFQFRRPTWDKLDLKWKEAENCSSSSADSTKISGFACPIIYHLRQITGNFSQTLALATNDGDNNNYNYRKTAQQQPYGSSSMIVEDFPCETIAPHFKSLIAGVVNISDYVQALSECPMGRRGIQQQAVTKEFVPNDEDQVFSNIMAALNRTFLHIHDASLTKSLQLDAFLALQSTLLTQQLLKSERWASAVETCSQHHRLAPDFISKDNLLAILNGEIASNILKDKINYEFSVPLDQVGLLYSLELADCVYTDDHENLLLRLLVPIRPREFAGLEYRQLHTVPSVYPVEPGYYKLCDIQGTPTEIAFLPADDNNNEDNEDTNASFHKVSCEGTISSIKLCHVSVSYKRDDKDNPTNDRPFECAVALLHHHNEQVILKHCKSHLTCSPFDLDDAPYIKRISPSTLFYSRVNAHFRPVHITVKSNGEGSLLDSFPVFNDTDVDEFLLHVPCNCSVWQNKTRIFSAPSCSTTSDGNRQGKAVYSRRSIKRLHLPQEILLPTVLQDSTNLYSVLKQRVSDLVAAEEERMRSQRRFHVMLAVLIMSLASMFSVGAMQLWRWKSRWERRKSSYAILHHPSHQLDQHRLVTQDDSVDDETHFP